MAFALPRVEDLRNPLLERDYVRICSRPAFFRNRTLGAVLIGAVLLLVYGLARDQIAGDRLGRTLHAVFTWSAALFLGSMAATEAATAIPTERATGTLTVLLTVPRSPRALATGFFLSRLLAALTALFGLLPLEGVALLLGGVSGADVLRSSAVVLSTGLFGGAAGLLAGHGAPDYRRALGRMSLLSMTLSLFIPAGLLWLAWYVTPKGQPPNPASPEFLRSLPGILIAAAALWFLATPVGALIGLSYPGSVMGLHAASPALLLALPAGAALLLAAVAILVTGIRLRDEAHEAALTALGPWAWVRSLLARRRGPGAEAAPAAAPTVPGSRPRVWRRALWWKEARPPRSFWLRWMARVAVLGYAALLAWLWFHPEVRRELSSTEDEEYAFYDFFIALPVLVVFVRLLQVGPTFLAEEREKSALDLLRAAPLRTSDFALARPVGALVQVAPMAAVSAAFALIGLVTGQVHLRGILAWCLATVLLYPFVAVFLFRAGMASPTVRAAGRRAGMYAGGATAVCVVACILLANLLPGRHGEWSLAALVPHPMAAFLGPYVLHAALLGRNADRAIAFGAASTFFAFLYFLVALRLWQSLPPALDRAFHAAEDGG